MFRSYFHVETVDELITTPRFAAIQQIGAASFATDTPPSLALLIRAEIEDRRRHIEEATDTLRAELAAWNDCPGRLLMPDTNLYLEHRNKFDEIHWDAVGGEAIHSESPS